LRRINKKTRLGPARHSLDKNRGLQAIVFDMDGVIVDSHPAHRFAWREFLGYLGRQVTDVELDFVLDGRKRKDILIHFLGPLTDKEVECYGTLKDDLFWRAAAEVAPISGALEFIEDIRQADIPMAVATSASAARAHAILKRLGIFAHFRTVVTGDEVINGKPNPAIYHLVCERINCSPAATVAVEDAVSGVKAAKAAGLKCVGISSSQSREKLTKAGADCVLENLSNLSFQDLFSTLGYASSW
jgi:beta-phosphoglucomutase